MGYNNDSSRTAVRLENKDRSRWYGLRPGDTVKMSGPGGYEVQGKVVHLHVMDNNGCTLRVRRGRVFTEIKGVCEWCAVIKRVEDK